MPYRHLAGLSKRRNEVCVHTENNKKQNCFCTLTLPYPNTHPPNGSCYFEPNLFPYHFLFLVHSTHIYLPVNMEQTECSETSAYKLQTPGNYPKENIQHTEHGESLKSRGHKILTTISPRVVAVVSRRSGPLIPCHINS